MAVSEVTDGVTCPSGSSLSQVVVLVTKGQERMAVCDVRLTNEAWSDEISILVKATTDQLYDGDHTANLTIQSQYIAAQSETAPKQLISSMVGCCNS